MSDLAGGPGQDTNVFCDCVIVLRVVAWCIFGTLYDRRRRPSRVRRSGYRTLLLKAHLDTSRGALKWVQTVPITRYCHNRQLER